MGLFNGPSPASVSSILSAVNDKNLQQICIKEYP